MGAVLLALPLAVEAKVMFPLVETRSVSQIQISFPPLSADELLVNLYCISGRQPGYVNCRPLNAPITCLSNNKAAADPMTSQSIQCYFLLRMNYSDAPGWNVGRQSTSRLRRLP